MAIEFCESGDLLNYLVSRAREGEIVPDDYRLFVAESLAKALVFLKSRKIVHRDLAARNVLLNLLFEPKLADFDLAVGITTGESHSKTSHSAPRGQLL